MKNLFLAVGNIILGSVLIYAVYTTTLDDGIKTKAETPTPTATATQTAKPTTKPTNESGIKVYTSGKTEIVVTKTENKTTYQKHELLDDGTARSYPIQEQEEVQQSGVSTAGVVPPPAKAGVPTDY